MDPNSQESSEAQEKPSDSSETGKSYLHRSQRFHLMDHDCLNVMYKDKLLCDVTLVAEGMEVPAHKLMLASCSAFFYWKFSKDRHLRVLNRIEIPRLTYETLSAVVRYLYECEILITEQNVGDLSAAASLFALKDLQNACRSFLEANLNVGNSMSTKRIATQSQYEELVGIVRNYMVTKFSELVKRDEFLEMDYEQVADLIGADSLGASDEEEVLDSVIRWVNYDLRRRKCHIYNLMDNVRLALISQSQILQRLEQEEWMKLDPQYDSILLKVFKCHIPAHPLHKFPKRRNTSKCLMIVGATDQKVLDVELYDVEKNVWSSWSGLPNIEFSDNTRAAILGTTVYLIEAQSVKFFKASAPTTQTKQLTYNELLKDRRYFSVATHNEVIYNIGGCCGSSVLSVVERLDVSSGKSEKITNMLEARTNAGSVVFQGNVYVFGGTQNISGSWVFLNSVECYHSDSNFWYAMPSMSAPRSRMGVTSLGDTLYVIGGWDGFYALNKVEAFNPTQLSWKTLAGLNVPRADPGVLALNGRLFVFGGFDGKVRLNSAEVYDPKLNTWTVLSSSMNTGKRYVSVGLVDQADMKL